jgi:signal transduction histidine kinase
VAHELNTPIGNSLVVATTMAEHVEALTADLATGLRRSRLDAYLLQAREAGEILVRNLHRAAGLVSSFKQLAVDNTSAQRRQFALATLLEDLVLPLRIATRHLHMTVTLTVAPGLSMDGYPGLLSRVLGSLLDNCQVHGFEGQPGGTIGVSAWPEGADVVAIAVADDGAGIAPELINKVYDPFFTTRLGAGGSGLGLHVAHNIVTGTLGGHISMESAPGQGTTVTLKLPRVSPAPEVLS